MDREDIVTVWISHSKGRVETIVQVDCGSVFDPRMDQEYRDRSLICGIESLWEEEYAPACSLAFRIAQECIQYNAFER